jgi:hypothetical protein
MGDQDQPVGRFWASTSGNFTITWLHSLSMFSLSIRPKVQFLVMLYQCLYIPTLLSFWGYVMLYIHIFRNKCPFIWIRESVSVGSWEEGTQPPTERLRNPSCFACSNAKPPNCSIMWAALTKWSTRRKKNAWEHRSVGQRSWKHKTFYRTVAGRYTWTAHIGAQVCHLSDDSPGLKGYDSAKWMPPQSSLKPKRQTHINLPSLKETLNTVSVQWDCGACGWQLLSSWP